MFVFVGFFKDWFNVAEMKYQIGLVLLRWSVKCKNSALLTQRGLRLLGSFLFTSPLSFQVRPIWQLEAEFFSEKTFQTTCCNEFATGKYFSCRKLQQFLAWGRGSILRSCQSSPIFLIKGLVILVYSRISWDSCPPHPKYYCDNCVHFPFSIPIAISVLLFNKGCQQLLQLELAP